MSNRYRSIDSIEANLRQRRMVDAAIQKRYLQRGGLRLDRLLAIYDDVLETAAICRRQDLVRMQQNPAALREKGERQIVSVSETRLCSAKQLHLMDRKDELMAASRSEIMAALEKAKPASEAEAR